MDVFLGGAWSSPSTAEAYVSGAWRTLQYGEAYIGGTWRTVANFSPATPAPPGGGTSGGGGGGSLALSVSPTSLTVFGRFSSLTSGSITVTPSGGLAPYTYAWSILGADAPSSLTAPTFATTAINCIVPSEEVAYATTIQCVVTDSLGVTATSESVTATFMQNARPDVGGP